MMKRILPALAFTVVMMSTLTPAEAKEQSLEEIIVTGRAEQFYLEPTTSLGSKIEIDVVNLPQSVQILSKQLIIDQAARDITDLYRSIAGISEFSYSGVTFRGFRDSGNVFYDGVRGDPYSGFSVPRLFNVERVEVLKGPAAALYGGGEPGGMINYVTRKASFESSKELVMTAGDDSLWGASLDSTGAISDSVAYRLGGFYEEKDSFRVNADHANLMLGGGLLFEISEDTMLEAHIDYVDQDLGGHRLRGAFVNDSGSFIVDPSYNTNEKSDYQNLEAIVAQSTLKHKFSDSLSLTATARYLDNEREQAYHEPRGWVDANGDGAKNAEDGVIQREYRDQYRSNEESSFTVDIVKKFTFAGLEHQFLIGSDYHEKETDYDYLRARYEGDGVVNLNVYNPNYGETNPSTYNLTDLNTTGGENDRYGLYIQELVVFNDQWSLMFGARYDHFDDKRNSDEFSFSDDNIAPRAGLVFKPNADGSIYMNYSESFKPASLSNQDDSDQIGALDPETGTQWELGWKQKFMDGKLLGTLAVYQINKEDFSQRNPLDTGDGDGIPDRVNLGEVESEGVELTLVGDLTPNWTMTANYAYNDTVVVVGDIGNTFGDGTKFVNAPEHQAGFWTRYDFESINSSIAFGAKHVSKRFSFQDQQIKAYTIFDTSWTTTWDALTLQINVRNLFDKEYAVSGMNERMGHFPGKPRTVIGQLTYNF